MYTHTHFLSKKKSALKFAFLVLTSLVLNTKGFSQTLTENTFIDLDKKISPSVVSISISVNFGPQGRTGFRDPFWDFFEQFMQPYPPQRPPGGPQDPEDNQPQAIGSGFIIDPTGLVITNFHVIEIADNVMVHLYGNGKKDGEKYEANVIGGDKRTDIALLQIKSSKKDFPAAPLGVSDAIQRGQWVAAFGNPYGHEFTITKGIVSAIGRRIRDLNAIPFIQTDAPINPGNSGGPLVSTKGEVIGVNTAIDGRGQGIGFAIPIDHVKSILPQLKSTGRVARGFIGVQIAGVTRQAQSALKLPNQKGALIIGVQEGGAADNGGMKPYDVITKFGDTKVESPDDLVDAVKDFSVGRTADVEVLREGKKHNLKIKVQEEEANSKIAKRIKNRKYRDDANPAPFKLGFKALDYSVDLAKEMNLPEKSAKNPIIVEVEAGSPAAQNGLRVGDVILDVNQQPVKSVKQVMQNLKKGSNILRVQHGDQVSLVFIEI